VSPANFQPAPHIPTWQEIEHASQVVRDAVHVTPMLHSRTFGTMTGANVYLKAENLQRTGSFKVRGATYKLAQLSEEERRRGVIATSMGNHAQAVAVAAQSFAAPATIVMPEQAPLVKVMATQGYGASVVLHGPPLRMPPPMHASCRRQQVPRSSTPSMIPLSLPVKAPWAWRSSRRSLPPTLSLSRLGVAVSSQALPSPHAHANPA
jgi:hypothetical protein